MHQASRAGVRLEKVRTDFAISYGFKRMATVSFKNFIIGSSFQDRLVGAVITRSLLNTPQAGGHVGNVESVGVVGLGHAKIAVRHLAF